jgi:hypothetical protein
VRFAIRVERIRLHLEAGGGFERVEDQLAGDAASRRFFRAAAAKQRFDVAQAFTEPDCACDSLGKARERGALDPEDAARRAWRESVAGDDLHMGDVGLLVVAGDREYCTRDLDPCR